MLRRLVLVAFPIPLALHDGIGHEEICRVYDSWIVPDRADTSIHRRTRTSSQYTVDSPLRSITGVLDTTTSAVATLSSRRARPVVRDARRGGSRRGTLSSRSTPTLFAELVARPTDGHTRASSPPPPFGRQLCLPPPTAMADDGAPRGTPPPRPSSRAPAATTRPPSRRPGPGRVRVRPDADGES